MPGELDLNAAPQHSLPIFSSKITCEMFLFVAAASCFYFPTRGLNYNASEEPAVRATLRAAPCVERRLWELGCIRVPESLAESK